MFYSNEVVLIDTTSARVTSKKRFSEIDLSDMSTYQNGIDKNTLGNDSINSRVFKIIDVLKDYDINKERRNPLGVLIESVGISRVKLRLICRATDLLYMSRTLFTIAGRNTEDAYRIYIDNERFFIDDTDGASEFVLYNSSIHSSVLHSTLSHIWANKQLVDKNDVRLYNGRTDHRRFHLRRDTRGLLRTIFYMAGREPETYVKCEHCDFISTRESGMAVFKDKRVCRDCYDDVKCRCDSCHTHTPISELVDIDSVQNSAKRNISRRADIEVCCNTCWDNFYIYCQRCKSVEYIDFETIRGKTNEDRIHNIRVFLHEAKGFSSIFSSNYCINCGTQVLNQYLLNPFRGKSLPNEYAGKSEFDRFVGIESEVISNYDGSDDYECSADIPRYFNVVDDGSLNSGGVEFVTKRPIIGNEINSALESLEEVNDSECNMVDSSCGVHIHMNAIDFNFIELKSLLMIMSRIQSPIYETLPEDRSKHYCRNITMSAKEIEKIDSLPILIEKYYEMQGTGITDNKYNEARYIGTNIHARFYMGSVEFRYHEGVISSSPIMDWIRFLNRIMKASTKLNKSPELYKKIVSSKTQPIDIIRDVAGLWGANYIEGRIDNK